MNKFAALMTLSILAGIAFAAQPARSAGPIPCEDMLKELRAALDTAKLNDADATKAKALEDKGIERCNADDDKRADDFFSQAMKIAGK
jgi:hypothetical protein